LDRAKKAPAPPTYRPPNEGQSVQKPAGPTQLRGLFYFTLFSFCLVVSEKPRALKRTLQNLSPKIPYYVPNNLL
jgi:hypothetical protein